LIHFEGLAGHPVRPFSLAWCRAAVRPSSALHPCRLLCIHSCKRGFMRPGPYAPRDDRRALAHWRDAESRYHI